MAQLTRHKRFQRSFVLSEGDVRLPKLFRQTVPQRWPGGGKTAVILVLAAVSRMHRFHARLPILACFGSTVSF